MRGSRLHQREFDIKDYQKDYSVSVKSDDDSKIYPEQYIHVPILDKKISKTQLITGICIIVIIFIFLIYSYRNDSKNITQTHAQILNSSQKLKRVKFNL